MIIPNIWKKTCSKPPTRDFGDYEDAKKVVSIFSWNIDRTLIRDITESLVVMNGRLAVIRDDSWDVNGILIPVGVSQL